MGSVPPPWPPINLNSSNPKSSTSKPSKDDDKGKVSSKPPAGLPSVQNAQATSDSSGPDNNKANGNKSETEKHEGIDKYTYWGVPGQVGDIYDVANAIMKENPTVSTQWDAINCIRRGCIEGRCCMLADGSIFVAD